MTYAANRSLLLCYMEITYTGGVLKDFDGKKRINDGFFFFLKYFLYSAAYNSYASQKLVGKCMSIN